MNFANVKSITISEGNVQSISCNGVELWRKGILPVGYRQVEYIETTGTQYIDTGVNAYLYNANGIEYNFKGCWTKETSGATINYLFGCLNNAQRSGNVSILKYDNRFTFQVYLGNAGLGYCVATGPEFGDDFEIYFKGTSTKPKEVVFKVNGQEIDYQSLDPTSDMPNDNIYLLWCKGVGSTSKPFTGRLYSFTMNDGKTGEAIRNFVPCYRVADNVIGLYDTVGGVFYTNAGTGSFTKGADVI